MQKTAQWLVTLSVLLVPLAAHSSPYGYEIHFSAMECFSDAASDPEISYGYSQGLYNSDTTYGRAIYCPISFPRTIDWGLFPATHF